MVTKILIIDDTRATREAMSRMLDCEGYESIQAADESQATTVLSRTVPDLIVLDMHIVESQGLDVLELLNAHPQWREVPVVVLTGICDTITVRCIRQHDARRRRVVRAAFSVREMMGQIRELTNRPTVHEPETASVN